MKVNDIVYGKHEFSEPVLIDLINSKTIQRLKGISQLGLPDELFYRHSFTRFEHTLGVSILISKLSGSLKEQIAGLLHDISHTAFSHLTDWVWGNPEKEDFQDNMYHKFLYSKEIIQILEKHEYEPKQFENLENFSILEQHIPKLCADRVDYCLREIATSGEKKLAKQLFDNLIAYNGIIHFKTKEKALEFANHFLDYQKNHWAGAEGKSRYIIFSKALKEAMKLGILKEQDFFDLDEKTIIKKLEEDGNELIKKSINNLRNNKVEILQGIAKKRYVDPNILLNQKSVKLSEINPEYAKTLAEIISS